MSEAPKFEFEATSLVRPIFVMIGWVILTFVLAAGILIPLMLIY